MGLLSHSLHAPARKLCDGLLYNIVLNAILVHRDVHKNIIIKLLYFDSPFRCL